MLQGMSAFSNSFVEAQPELLRFLLSTTVAVFLLRKACAQRSNIRGRQVVLILAILLLVRLAPIVTVSATHEKAVLRIEEDASPANDPYGSGKFCRWLVMVAEVSLCCCIKSHAGQLQPSSRGQAIAWVGRVAAALASAAVLAYWARLGGSELDLIIPRISYAAIAAGLVALAAMQPLHTNMDNLISVRLGWALILLAILDVLLLGPQSPPALVSMGSQCWLLLQLKEAQNQSQRGSKPSRTGDVALFTAISLMIGRQHFFVTGHAQSFAKVDVGAPFVGFADVHSGVGKARSAMLVLYNTFGTQVLSWVGVPLLSVPMSAAERRAGADHTVTVLLCILWQAVAVLLTSISAAMHRRHLMMWRVFAPNLCFEAIGLYLSSFIFLPQVLFSVEPGSPQRTTRRLLH